jgi:hypothetical protein
VHTLYCKACASGRYLETGGGTNETDCIKCPLGKFSVPTGIHAQVRCFLEGSAPDLYQAEL